MTSVLQLAAGPNDACLVAVATRVAGPSHPGGIESWDLMVCGEGFEALSLDPFSFAGRFLFDGFSKLSAELLGPAGVVLLSQWSANPDGSQYHATMQWISPARIDPR